MRLPPVLDVTALPQAELSATAKQLIEKIQSKTARVAIIGLGYVGLPLAVCIAKVGFSVIGIDVNPRRVEKVNTGDSYITDVESETLQSLVNTGAIEASTHFDCLDDADAIVICVPTPLTKNRDPDISYIRATTTEIAQRLRPGQLISLESTTYPGTTQEVMLPILEKVSGLRVGQDFFLSHSPERVDPGNARYTTHNTNKVVGGVTTACNQVAAAFYRQSIQHVVSVSSPGCAEMVKVFENTFRAVNIALVNELALLCDKMNLNVWEVVDAAATKPFGMMRFTPGPGVGGHCIPIDPFYLTWKAREYNFHTRFIELAGEINSHMPQFVREKILRALGKRGKPLYGSSILLMGMAYKKDLGDWRQSPALDLFHLLQQDQAAVMYHDPHVPKIEDSAGQEHYSRSLTEDTLALADCVVIVTDHSEFDYEWIVQHSPVVVDTRNATAHIADTFKQKVILL
ncbi:MAG: nucleotide sugar dehydrogenase [Candidatus Melainabacteria bacterium]|nr:nucleotide sugar dehydrogenase [Candidatus Melainabacteria bacterium]